MTVKRVIFLSGKAKNRRHTHVFRDFSTQPDGKGTVFDRFDGLQTRSKACPKIIVETVRQLWETFGGSVNSKGYKVLDSHIKVIRGDSITPQRAEIIYKILIENGFGLHALG